MMFGGKLVKIIPNPGEIRELLDEVTEGYLKLAGKMEGDIVQGVILLKERVPKGAYIENVQKTLFKMGGDALRLITEISSTGGFKVCEVYTTQVEEILKENPKLKINWGKEVIPWSNLEEFYRRFITFSGRVRIQDGDSSWDLIVKNGYVLNATMKNKNLSRVGDDAVKALLREVPELIKHGKGEFQPELEISSEGNVLTAKTHLSEVFDLLKTKREIERKRY